MKLVRGEEWRTIWASHTQSLTMAGAKKIVARRAQ
jgi:hypothetical protein